MENNSDFDNLKNRWQQNLEIQVQTTHFTNNQEIKNQINMIQEKTSSASHKLRNNLLLEILTTIPLLVGAWYLSVSLNIKVSPILWAIFTIFTLGGHIVTYIRLKQNDIGMQESLLVSIQKHIRSTEPFVRFYQWVTYLGAALIFMAGTFHTWVSDEVIQVKAAETFLMALAAIGFYVCTKWYVHRLYDRHYQSLRNCEQELLNQ